MILMAGVPLASARAVTSDTDFETAPCAVSTYPWVYRAPPARSDDKTDTKTTAPCASIVSLRASSASLSSLPATTEAQLFGARWKYSRQINLSRPQVRQHLRCSGNGFSVLWQSVFAGGLPACRGVCRAGRKNGACLSCRCSVLTLTGVRSVRVCGTTPTDAAEYKTTY